MLTNPSPSSLRKILVGMSGGVDSSLAAALLVEKGHEVVGGFMKNWSDSKDLWTGECQWRYERRDALRVAARLGIPLLTFDFEEAYRERVLGRMFAEYEAGRTPNPDVLCNEEIKFGLFFEKAMALGFDGVATGHYSRVDHQREVTRLLKAVDEKKDQTYFLHRLSQNVLRRTLFPIGAFLKSEVRSLAEERALPTAQKPDSQGICFVGKLDFHTFLRKKIPAKPGPIITPGGEVIGRHDGLDAYTIGQRQGLLVCKDQRAWYVAGKDYTRNELLVVPEREHPLLYQTEAMIEQVHWILGKEMSTDLLKAEVVTRYHQAPVGTELVRAGTCLQARFAQPVWAVAAGQSAVFYQGDECLGGGVLQDPCSVRGASLIY